MRSHVSVDKSDTTPAYPMRVYFAHIVVSLSDTRSTFLHVKVVKTIFDYLLQDVRRVYVTKPVAQFNSCCNLVSSFLNFELLVNSIFLFLCFTMRRANRSEALFTANFSDEASEPSTNIVTLHVLTVTGAFFKPFRNDILFSWKWFSFLYSASRRPFCVEHMFSFLSFILSSILLKTSAPITDVCHHSPSSCGYQVFISGAEMIKDFKNLTSDIAHIHTCNLPQIYCTSLMVNEDLECSKNYYLSFRPAGD